MADARQGMHVLMAVDEVGRKAGALLEACELAVDLGGDLVGARARPVRHLRTSVDVVGNSPSGASPGMAPSGAPSVRLRCRPIATNERKRGKAARLLAPGGQS